MADTLERYSPTDIEQRPFAVSLGYDEWAADASSIVGALQLDALARRRIDSEKIDMARAWGSDVCKLVCEVGYETREISTLILPSSYDLARNALNEDRDEEHYTAFQQGLVGRWLGMEPSEVQDAYRQLSRYVPRVAEAAFLWGRHGKVIGLSKPLPTVVREGELSTIRPAAIGQRTRELETKIAALREAITPHKPSSVELLAAKLSRRAAVNLWAKTAMSEVDLGVAVSDAISRSLTDLAEES